MRESKLSGVYFHAAPTLIDQQIEQAFKHGLGPGELPVNSNKENVKGMIVPQHAYDLAGPCAAWTYKILAESKDPDIIIIVGQGDESGVTEEPWNTPYGIVRVDQVFVRALVERKNIAIHNKIFDEDEQIESQLPFLQYIYKKKGPKIVPIMLNNKTDLKELAVDIKEILMEQNKRAVIVVPSNLTHFGRNYGYVPFSHDEHKQVYEMDKEAIELIQKKDVDGLLNYIDTHGMNTTNYLGIIFSIYVLKPEKILLEQYYTSADMNKDYKNFVSFSAIVMK